MAALCLCFAIHEPYFLRRYTIFDVNEDSTYEDDDRSCNYIISAAQNCYLPMFELFYKQFREYQDAFKISLTVSSTALDLFEQYAPEVLASLKTLASTNCVEFVTETAPHSLAFLYSQDEFKRQVQRQNERLNAIFDVKPQTFRHTELLFNNDLASALKNIGITTVLAEGSRDILGWRNTNYVYNSFAAPEVNVLLRNGRLSGDLSSRFNDKSWDQWPLTADKFASWCSALKSADCINIFTDFHVFGLRNPKETGIFEFMQALPKTILDKGLQFMTPSQIVATYPTKDSLDFIKTISWRDEGCDIQGWLGNEMQRDAIQSLYSLANRVRKLNDQELGQIYDRLQTSDYFHFMSTRWFSESQPDRPTPFSSPYDAYISYMNILEDFKVRLQKAEDLAHKEELSTVLDQDAKPSSAKFSEPTAEEIEAHLGLSFKTCIRQRHRLQSDLATDTAATATDAEPKISKVKTKPKKSGKPSKASKKIAQAKKAKSSRSKS